MRLLYGNPSITVALEYLEQRRIASHSMIHASHNPTRHQIQAENLYPRFVDEVLKPVGKAANPGGEPIAIKHGLKGAERAKEKIRLGE